jgi:Na+/citrate or Na+/malate symporter
MQVSANSGAVQKNVAEMLTFPFVVIIASVYVGKLRSIFAQCRAMGCTSPPNVTGAVMAVCCVNARKI